MPKYNFKRPLPKPPKVNREIMSDGLPANIFEEWDLVPKGVQDVYLLNMADTARGFTSISANIKRNEAIRKYPKWFPWEVKYNSIPQEVHDAYQAEAYPDAGKGLLERIYPFAYDPVGFWKDREPIDVIREMISSMNNADAKRKEKERLEKARLIQLWNKHYGPYILEFRG